MEQNKEVTLDEEIEDLTKEFEESEGNINQDSTENQPDESSVPSDSNVDTNNQNVNPPSEESVNDVKDDKDTNQNTDTKDKDQDNQTNRKRKTAKERIKEIIAEKKLEQEKVKEYQKKLEESQIEIAKLKQDKPKHHPNDPVPEYTAEDIEKYKDSLEKDGDHETAGKVAKLYVQKLKFERNRAMIDQEAKQKEYQTKFQDEWNKNLENTKRQNPDLNNKESLLYKKTVDILDKQEAGKILMSVPNGVKLATDLAKLQIQVENAIKTEKELEEIKSKYQTLINQTALNGDTTTFVSENTESEDPDKAYKSLMQKLRSESS